LSNSYLRQLPHIADYPGGQTLEAVAEPVQDKPAAGLSIPQVLAIARHYWRQGVVVAAGVIVVSAVLIKLLPKTYTATATLIVNPVRQGAFPQDSSPGIDMASYLATQSELIMSSVVLLPVVDRLGLAHAKGYTSGFDGRGTPARREYAEKTLAASLNIQQGAGNQLLYIAAAADGPAKAATLANAVADSYLQLERQRANDPVAQQAERSSEELAELRTQVTAAQQQVTQFRQRNGLTTLNPETDDSAMQALQSLQTRLLEAQNERRTLEARQAGQIATGNEALASNHVGELRTDLANLRSKLAQLRPTLGPKHPEILALESQIGATEGSLRAALQSLSGNITTQLARERDLEANLTQAAAAQRAKVLHLRQIQDQGAKLQLELESAQSVYKEALAGYDQVKSAALQDFAHVSLISRATPPIDPAKPNKKRLFALAIIGALAAGLAIPLAYELFIDRRLRCRDDLERGFGLRVLAQLDPLQTQSGGA